MTQQLVWRKAIAAYLFLAGAGAGTFLTGTAADLLGFGPPAWVGMVLGLPIVAASTLFLIGDLGRPEKFLAVFRHPRSSWISRGSLILVAFLGTGTIAILARIVSAEGSDPGGLVLVIELAAFALALMVGMYTGLLLSVASSRPFWNNALLPVLFLVSAGSTGAALLIVSLGLWYPWAPAGNQAAMARLLEWLRAADAGFLVLELVFVYLYVVVVAKRAAAAVNILLSGELAAWFWGVFVGVGLAMPITLDIVSLAVSDTGARFVIAIIGALGVLVGGFALRYLVLAAGIRAPVFLQVPFLVRPEV